MIIKHWINIKNYYKYTLVNTFIENQIKKNIVKSINNNINGYFM